MSDMHIYGRTRGTDLNDNTVWHDIWNRSVWDWINEARRGAKRNNKDYSVNFGSTIGNLSSKYLRDDSNFHECEYIEVRVKCIRCETEFTVLKEKTDTRENYLCSKCAAECSSEF